MGLGKTSRIFCTLTLCATIVAASGLQASALSSAESETVRRVNGARSARGIPSLRVAADLNAVARAHSARMAAARSVYHNPNLGSEVDGWRLVAENVGRGPTVRDVHEAFMDSYSHRVHILDSRMSELGVGVSTGKDGLRYVTQIFRRPSSGSSPPRTVVRSTRAPKVAARRPEPPPKPPRPKPVQSVQALVRLLSIDADGSAPSSRASATRAIAAPISV